jgi:hypothetical protein
MPIVYVSRWLLTFKHIDLNNGLRCDLTVYKEEIKSEGDNKITIREESLKGKYLAQLFS